MPQSALVRDHFHAMGEDGSYAAFYGERGASNHDFYARRDRVQEFLLKHMKAGQRALDVGCGTGPMVQFICEHGLHYSGVDVAKGMLDSIEKQFGRSPCWKNMDLRIGTSEKIPYESNSFDYYIGMGLLEYLDDMEPSLKEMERVLKPGGYAILTMPNIQSINRTIIRNTGFLRRAYDLALRAAKRQVPTRNSIFHRELAPDALDRMVSAADFKPVGRDFYDFKVIFYPVSRILPALAYQVNRRAENKGPGFFANAFVGYYQKTR